MKYYSNPINFEYKYQFNKQSDGTTKASREAADPSLVMFKGKYLLFPSMTCGFIYSDNLVEWKYHSLKNLPAYDYAPDVRVVGDWLYFCASNHEQGTFYRTMDPFSDDYEKIDGHFPFWDPHMFIDEDNRLYFFWGSSATEPLYGIELDVDTLEPIGNKQELVKINQAIKGFERTGENHVPERTQAEKNEILKNMENTGIPSSMLEAAKVFILGLPYAEGVWVNKHKDTYYLQYGTPGSRFNIYGDGVYVSNNPLGPYTLAANNPFSYKPGGFIPGAGHGSSMEDCFGNLWHTATMRICVNHNFERRIGLWPSGWDEDGEMFCNTRYGDWPQPLREGIIDPWESPEWMLLSYGKSVKASSSIEDNCENNVVNENVQNWWRAASNSPSEWIEVDLEKLYNVHAIQLNFADDNLVLDISKGAELHGALQQERWIDEVPQPTRWLLEGSVDGDEYFVIEDKRSVTTDLSHDLVICEEGIEVRFLRLSNIQLPYNQNPCVSGLRVFGLDNCETPQGIANLKMHLEGDLDLFVSWNGDAVGYVVLWGNKPDKLYHSYMVFDTSVKIGAIVKGQDIYIRIDSFNESGIKEGHTFKYERRNCE